jgi:L-ribulose-5-phosphate 3-epimerase
MIDMPRIAIMQGRLLPPQHGRIQCFPRDRWREEFARAAEAGLDAIEWIYDLQGADVNPLATDPGIAEMQDLSRRHRIAVASLCAVYFMDRPFAGADPEEFARLTEHLLWLLDRCRRAAIGRVVLPFIEVSRIRTAAQEDAIVEMLRNVLAHTAEGGVELHLEIDYGPEALGAMLDKLPHAMLKVNYDSGNSASLGYDVRRELAAYAPRIGSVHIKDRIRGGSTVPLGQGDADIPGLLTGLQQRGYDGDFVLEVARPREGDEVAWARHNRSYLVEQLENIGLIAAGGPR